MPDKDLHQQLLSMDRRSFMRLLATAAAAYPLSLLADKRATQATTAELQEPWKTLDIVMEHLFPAEDDSPGSRDIQAITYMQNMLQAPDVAEAERDFIFNGVGWLNDLAEKNHSAKFPALNETQREIVLRTIEQSRAGERWLSLLLTWLIEALLSDPVYGGNPNGIGWKWLEHQPGYPTPSPDKMYFKLGQITHKRTKA
ncbi:MAG TPA: gluconate 2-dehydrogenase subunit 3 family protein [Gammaproteobacteria bacterium]